MTVSVTHATVAVGANDPTKEVSSTAWNQDHTITGLATVAETGAYSDLSGKPTLGALAAKDTAAVADISATGTPGNTTFLRGDGTWSVPSGSGDMDAATYDPQNIADDAFDRANHTGSQLAATISDFSTAADARVSAAIGVSVQAYAANLTSWAAVAPSSYLTTATAASTYQPLDSDLTAFAALSPTNDDFVQRKAGAWTNRTVAQVLTDLAAPGTTFQPLATVLTNTTASFTTTLETKLNGIETGADVTDAANVDAAGAVMNTDTSTASMSFVIDEDNMASDSATKVPTQQSVKAYADTFIAKSLLTTRGDIITRGASAPQRLALGTSGYFLKSDGTDAVWGAVPSAGWTVLAGPTSLSGSSAVVTGISQSYGDLMILLSGASHDAGSNRAIQLKISTNNGSSYSSAFLISASVAASAVLTGGVLITNYAGDFGLVLGGMSDSATDPFIDSSPSLTQNSAFKGSGGIDAITIDLNSTGSFDAGTYTILAR